MFSSIKHIFFSSSFALAVVTAGSGLMIPNSAQAACCSYGCCDCSCVSFTGGRAAAMARKLASAARAAGVKGQIKAVSIDYSDRRSKAIASWKCSKRAESAVCTRS